MSEPPSLPMPNRASELRALLRLALPLIAGHAGHQLMSFVDTAMVGRLGAEQLAGVGIGNGIFFFLTIAGMGCVLGMDPLVSQALGAGQEVRARRTLWQGARVAVLTGVPLTLLVGVVPYLLEPLGVDAEVAAETHGYLLGRLPGVLPFLLFAATRSYLQAHHRTGPILLSVLVANIGNFLANSILIFGDEALETVGLPGLGLPALGVLGAGIASTVATVLSVVVLARAIGRIPAAPDPGRRARAPALLRDIFRLGVPIGLQFAAEVGVFALAGALAGVLGALPGAGNQVAITLASFSFTVTLGISAATSVRVGRHVGGNDTPAARKAGLLGLGSASVFMVFSALVFLLAPQALARILTDDVLVIAAAQPLIMIAAVFQLSDGIQVVAAGALRGAGDTRYPMVINLVAHYLIGLPVAIALAFAADLGAPGLWWGLCAGLTAVALALAFRFVRLSSRPILRVP